jgi:hypothetical protein
MTRLDGVQYAFGIHISDSENKNKALFENKALFKKQNFI